MKILFVVPYVPDRIRVRPYNLIRHLSDLGHSLTVMTLWTNEVERSSLSDLKFYCRDLHAFYQPHWRSFWNSMAALPTYTPLQSVFSWHPGMANQIEAIAYPCNERPGFDVIHVEHIRGARYGLRLKKHRSGLDSQIPVVWDSVDSIGHLFRQTSRQSRKAFGRWMARFELRRTEWYEDWLINQFDRVLVTSEQDKKAFLLYPSTNGKSDKVSILRNGVDIAYFKADRSFSREPATLVVSGKMSYHANLTMVMHLIDEIMPLVWASRQETKVWIVGKDPPKMIRSLASDPRILVTGTVDDIRPYLQRATVAVAPVLYGAGIQNKVLEAMACATPVVASPQAVSALDVKPGIELLTARDPMEYAGTILKLLNERNFRVRMGQAGRKFVEKYHHWPAIASQLEEIYQQAIDGE